MSANVTFPVGLGLCSRPDTVKRSATESPGCALAGLAESDTVGVTVPVAGLAAANTVPCNWSSVGELVELKVAVMHGGGPAVSTTGVTGCHAPAPAFALGLNHCNDVAPPRSQSTTVAEVNAFGVETRTSKNDPPTENGGVATGSLE